MKQTLKLLRLHGGPPGIHQYQQLTKVATRVPDESHLCRNTDFFSLGPQGAGGDRSLSQASGLWLQAVPVTSSSVGTLFLR